MRKLRELVGLIKNKVATMMSAAGKLRPHVVIGKVPKSRFLVGWLPPVGFFLLAGLAAVSGKPFWTFFWLSAIGVYLLAFLKQIRDPDQANVFQFGKFMGRVGAGLYISVPDLMDLEVVGREVFDIPFTNVKLYTAAGTEVTASFIAVFQIGDTEDDLKKALEIDSEERDRLFHHMVRSKVGTAVGSEGGFLEFNKRQANIEEKVMSYLNAESRKYGYITKEVEVYIEEETVVAQAEKIKIIGKARGEEARAISEPFKDNWPAAAVAVANMAFEKPVRDVLKAAGSEKGVKNVSDAAKKISRAAGAIKDAVIGRPDGGA